MTNTIAYLYPHTQPDCNSPTDVHGAAEVLRPLITPLSLVLGKDLGKQQVFAALLRDQDAYAACLIMPGRRIVALPVADVFVIARLGASGLKEFLSWGDRERAMTRYAALIDLAQRPAINQRLGFDAPLSFLVDDQTADEVTAVSTRQ